MLVQATINIGDLQAGQVGEMDDDLARVRMAKGWVMPAPKDEGDDPYVPLASEVDSNDQGDEPAGKRGRSMRARTRSEGDSSDE